MSDHRQQKSAIRILFFIESLEPTGKERRFTELLGYLARKPGYQMKVVLTRNTVHYPAFYRLGIPLEVIERPRGRKAPGVFKRFYDICRDFDPDYIHVWGNMVAFYALPAVLLQRRPLLNSQITNAVSRPPWWSFTGLTMTLNFAFSDIVTSNTLAGLRSHRVDGSRSQRLAGSQNQGGTMKPDSPGHGETAVPAAGKFRVIPNGIDPARFEGFGRERLRGRFGLQTPYAVAMVASFSVKKDYKRYIEACRLLLDKRSDITFFAVGDGPDLERIRRRVPEHARQSILFTGAITDVEALLSVCDIGVLLTDQEHAREGMANALIEYMASGLPVIADDSGGTPELVRDGTDGYLLPGSDAKRGDGPLQKNRSSGGDADPVREGRSPDGQSGDAHFGRSPERIAELIDDLINDHEKRRKMGDAARSRIAESFTVDRMGAAFEALYREVTKN